MDEVKNVADMTDREIAEELLTSFREVKAQLAGAGQALASNPMLGRMFGGLANALG